MGVLGTEKKYLNFNGDKSKKMPLEDLNLQKKNSSAFSITWIATGKRIINPYRGNKKNAIGETLNF